MTPAPAGMVCGQPLTPITCCLCGVVVFSRSLMVQYVLADGFVFPLCEPCAPRMAPTPGYGLAAWAEEEDEC